ncbi:hypothetical protein NM688_g5512 [Phlebia brevispora]|uniref:Uncharacterized protein n=1 Tax=Phlebia brevispora TaxID=194682 RepID=A0ACC1SU74_9APHY|nr:hypothetical protein NM688_g5512 [Phlebia brevispora]
MEPGSSRISEYGDTAAVRLLLHMRSRADSHGFTPVNPLFVCDKGRYTKIFPEMPQIDLCLYIVAIQPLKERRYPPGQPAMQHYGNVDIFQLVPATACAMTSQSVLTLLSQRSPLEHQRPLVNVATATASEAQRNASRRRHRSIDYLHYSDMGNLHQRVFCCPQFECQGLAGFVHLAGLRRHFRNHHSRRSSLSGHPPSPLLHSPRPSSPPLPLRELADLTLSTTPRRSSMDGANPSLLSDKASAEEASDATVEPISRAHIDHNTGCNVPFAPSLSQTGNVGGIDDY